jgi:diketogulonate reductase-like aldo/keto reductase
MHTDEQHLSHLREISREKPLSRRDFVKSLTLATAAGPGMISAALSGFMLTRSQRSEAYELIVQNIGQLPKVRYGRTGMKVTPICISQDWNRELIAPALAVGVNFIHKAGYWGTVPDEIAKLPRESYFTDTTVDNTSPHHDPDNWQEAYDSVVASLKRNGLKYYDVYRAHYGWHSVDKFKNNNISYKAFEQLKKEGYVKHFAVSQHPYRDSDRENIPDYPGIIDAETESGIIESMQVWYSYGYPKEVEDAFARASKAGVAMTAMKINAHGDKMRSNASLMAELKAADQPGKALIRQVMAHTRRQDGKPIFCTCVSALQNMEQFEQNVGALSPQVASNEGYDGLKGIWA